MMMLIVPVKFVMFWKVELGIEIFPFDFGFGFVIGGAVVAPG